MKISLCTITFRHHLVGLDHIAQWACANGFQGIEIWGAHARNLPDESSYDAQWLSRYGLTVPMISDYLPLDQPDALVQKTKDVLYHAKIWGAKNIRTFAGKSGSAATDADQRRQITAALRQACEQISDQGHSLLIETHPGTLADSLDSTCQLIEDVNHPGLGINFDALHVWEGGDDPVAARRVLGSKVGNYHFKNIAHRRQLSVFAPDNIYNAAGSRDGIVPLFDGQMDYRDLMAEMALEGDCNVSLEWFGGDVFNTLKTDCTAIRQTLADLTKTSAFSQAS